MRFITLLLIMVGTALSGLGLTRDVHIHNGDVILAGTLSEPGGTPRAVIVLASGSGAQNRDEELLGHRPFRIIADTLTAAGYAVLRLDDRGTGQSTGVYADATIDDLDSDIAAALVYADSCFSGIRKGVLGHSLGGQSAVKMAARDKCDFIVTLAAPAWRGDSIVMSQARALATALTGRWDGEQLQRRLLDIAAADMPDYLARSMISMELAKSLGDAARLPAVRESIEANTSALLSPAYRGMLRYDPAGDIAAVGVPWLALNGDCDTQVLPGNLATIARLNPAADTVVLPQHNHLFQTCTTGLVNEYSTLGQAPSSRTLAEIIAWLTNL